MSDSPNVAIHKQVAVQIRPVTANRLMLLLAIMATAAAGAWSSPAYAASQIIAGWGHTCAIQTTTSKAICWGANDSGQTSVPATLGRVRRLSAGAVQTRAIQKTTSKAICWGADGASQSNVRHRCQSEKSPRSQAEPDRSTAAERRAPGVHELSLLESGVANARSRGARSG